MKKAGILSTFILASLVFIIAATPATDDFFESVFDGLWAGYADAKIEGGNLRLPIVLNFNALDSTGEGFVLLIDAYSGDTANSYTGPKVLSLTNVKIKGKKLSFSFDINEPNINEPDYAPVIFNFVMRLNKAGDLAGKYTSDYQENPKGRTTLYRMDDAKPLQGVWLWESSWPPYYFLQLVQNSPVSGYAGLFDVWGPIQDGDFSNNRLTGSVSAAGSTKLIDMTYSAAKRQLKGTLNYLDAGPTAGPITMRPLGTSGKKIKISSVSPSEITAGAPGRVAPGATTTLTIKGSNFAEGAMVHLDRPEIEVCCVDFVSAKTLKVNVSVSANVAAGTKVSLRVVNPDNRIAEKSNALTISGSDGGGGGGPTVSFANDIRPVFDDNCVVCHGQGGNAGLDLRQGSAYGNIVNVASTEMTSLFRIEPGDPDNSYLIRKIKGVGISGSRMPFGGPFLSNAVIAKFETWVNEGALNN
jgi:hypothetical protein